METMAPPRLAAIASRTPSERAFLGASALVFAASTAWTIMECMRMSAMGGMSMTGMPLCGQTWLGAAASFLGMWIVMMMAMMLPSIAPMLWRYRQAVDRAGASWPNGLAMMAGVGYFSVWAAFGITVFVLDAALRSAEPRLPALTRVAPIATDEIVLIAGLLQFTAWKARSLACCRHMPRHDPTRCPTVGAAWRHGLRLGRHCSECCAGLTAVLLAIGAMDWRVMLGVSAAITAERWMPNGTRVARVIGVGLIALGVALAIGFR